MLATDYFRQDSTCDSVVPLTGSHQSHAHSSGVAGMDYRLPSKGSPIVGHEYLSLLAQHTPGLSWDSAATRPVSEHIFYYVEADRTGHRVYYPSLLSIHKRLQLAERQKVGISIWELGQVMPGHFQAAQRPWALPRLCWANLDVLNAIMNLYWR